VSVWTGGRALPDGESGAAGDRGLLLGDGLFETIHVRDGVALHLDRHLGRLQHSADALGIPFPARLAASVAEALPELLRVEASPARAALRLCLTRGRGRGLVPKETSAPGQWISLSGLDDRPRGEPSPAVSAVVVPSPRVDPTHPLAGHKSLSAGGWVMARRAALAAGADVALLSTVDGDVVEGDSANLFLVVGGSLLTPPLARGVLPGITRTRVLETSAAIERVLAAEDLLGASEAFLTSSLAGVQPLRSIDGRRLLAPGPVAVAVAARLVD
jgi:branched-chain amino acid aminotransferase